MERISLRTSRAVIPVALSLTATIVLVQVTVPLGWALAGLYIIPVAFVALWSSFRHVFLVVWLTMLCTLLGTFLFFASPFWDNRLALVASFLVPLTTQWSLAILSLVRKDRERRMTRVENFRTICASCKRVRSEAGEVPIERYAQQHLGSLVCLGLCEACTSRWGLDRPGSVGA